MSSLSGRGTSPRANLRRLYITSWGSRCLLQLIPRCHELIPPPVAAEAQIIFCISPPHARLVLPPPNPANHAAATVMPRSSPQHSPVPGLARLKTSVFLGQGISPWQVEKAFAPANEPRPTALQPIRTFVRFSMRPPSSPLRKRAAPARRARATRSRTAPIAPACTPRLRA